MRTEQMLALVKSLDRQQRNLLLQWLQDEGDYRDRREALKDILAAPRVFRYPEEVIDYVLAQNCPEEAAALLRPFIGRFPGQQVLDDLIRTYAEFTDQPNGRLDECIAVFGACADALKQIQSETYGFGGALLGSPYWLPARLHDAALRTVDLWNSR